MHHSVLLINPHSRQIRTIKVGFSWILLFGSSLSFPLFVRKLDGFAVFMLAMSIMSLQTYPIADGLEKYLLVTWYAILTIGMSIWLGFQGNRLSALALLDRGWQFFDSQSTVTLIARRKWDLDR